MENRKILYLFDVDGTLTKPRQVISKELKQFLLNKVKPKVALGLVSGSDYSKVAEQMDGEEAAAHFDYVFCENGLMYFRNGQLVSAQSILNHLGEQTLQKVINFALNYMSKLELPAKRGNFIEFRTSMINICPVGRSCNQTERDQFVQFDAVHKVRETFVKVLQREFASSGLTFALGGQISVDVFPNGWDKTYCLRHVECDNYEEIHFFGDKTDPGGNDYEIYTDQRTIGHMVTSPDDTKQQVQQSLNIL
ncbi:probable phosphomannomutase [Hyposmocoma kahamanoa]|uniref:probable phosphomannomutase n=1 Tax=Hyposmocoma kahamanoa TaxID=1477025 RepID=UPI000E6D7392|nr:probable phosphomannomutase [Hyposmocoma kahamanoa]